MSNIYILQQLLNYKLIAMNYRFILHCLKNIVGNNIAKCLHKNKSFKGIEA